MNSGNRRQITACWLVAVLLGAINAWAWRYGMRSDTVSYLDMSDDFLRGHWMGGVRGLWSPLYPWVISLARRILRPPAELDFPVVHLVDFAAYLFGLACFHFLLAELVRYHRLRLAFGPPEGGVILPEPCWWLLGFALYIWSSLDLILRAPAGTPDMLMAAFVYWAAGLLLRIRAGSAGPGAFALLGAVLGLGYLAKAVMFLLAFVFLGVAAVSGGLKRAALALAVFLSIAGPFVAALSYKLGHLSFGEAGKLNYVWAVNGVPKFTPWLGGDSHGAPKHSPRKLSDHPSIYEFGSGMPGTYPLWSDAAYWYDGVIVRFRPGRQLRALASNTRIYFNLLLRQGGLVVGFLAVCLVSRRWRLLLREASAYAGLLAPALAAVLLYWPVYVEWRYVGVFVVLLWLGFFSAVRLPAAPEVSHWLSSLTLAMVSFLMPMVLALTLYQWRAGVQLAADPSRQVARNLSRLGLQPGDPVGLIGWGRAAYWARLARLRIGAEIMAQDAPAFWSAPEPARAKWIQTFAATGVKAIVAEKVPDYPPTGGWHKVGPDYYVSLLGRSSP